MWTDMPGDVGVYGKGVSRQKVVYIAAESRFDSDVICRSEPD